MICSQATAQIEGFQREQNRRIAARLLDEFERQAARLESEIRVEEERTKNSDPNHYAYSTIARAARIRRDNLCMSRDELRHYLESSRTSDEQSEQLSAA